VATEAERRPEVVQLMSQKGVGPVTGLAFVLTVGPAERFPNSGRLVSYLGLNPSDVVLKLPPERPGVKALGGFDISRWKLHVVNAKIGV
jgi:hypothetical protein